MEWAEQQLAQAQRDMGRSPYIPPNEGGHIDVIPGSSPLSGHTWTIKTSDSSNGLWVDNVPVTMTAPVVHTTMIVPKIGYMT